MNLDKDLVADLALGLVSTARDLSVVAYTPSRVYVMSAGKIVETGKPLDLCRQPQAKATRERVGVSPCFERGLAGNAVS